MRVSILISFYESYFSFPTNSARDDWTKTRTSPFPLNSNSLQKVDTKKLFHIVLIKFICLLNVLQRQVSKYLVQSASHYVIFLTSHYAWL